MISTCYLTAKATKTHFYWAMRSNDGTEAGFQQYLLNVVDHYQVNFMYTGVSIKAGYRRFTAACQASDRRLFTL